MPTVYILVLPRQVNNSWPAGVTKAEVSPSLFTPLLPSLFTPHQILYSAPLMATWLSLDHYFLHLSIPKIVPFILVIMCHALIIIIFVNCFPVYYGPLSVIMSNGDPCLDRFIHVFMNVRPIRWFMSLYNYVFSVLCHPLYPTFWEAINVCSEGDASRSWTRLSILKIIRLVLWTLS